MFIKMFFALTTTSICIFGTSYAGSIQATEASNWCSQAEANLTNKDGEPLSCKKAAKRCVKMNNYWCQKHSNSPWRGTTKAEGGDGNRDTDGHAIFDSVEWSARAIAIDLRAKYRRGLLSAVDIGSTYSPWCDTLGSRAVVNGHGRTCKDGRAKPPAYFTGPFCAAPALSNPSKNDCKSGCNCPPSIATTLVRDLGIGINEDLKLFDSNGRPLPNLNIVIRNLAIQEQGIFVRPEIISAGIKKL